MGYLSKSATLDVVKATIDAYGQALTKVQIEACLEAYSEVVIAAVKNDNTVWSPIGIFKPKKLKARSGVNRGIGEGKNWHTEARTTLKLDPAKKYYKLDN